MLVASKITTAVRMENDESRWCKLVSGTRVSIESNLEKGNAVEM